MSIALAWLGALLTASVLLVVALVGLPIYGTDEFRLIFAMLSGDVMVYASVGGVLALRRPGNIIGPLLLCAAILIAATFLGFVLGGLLSVTRGPNDVPAGIAALTGGLLINATIIAAGPAIALVFPDGRLPSPRWRLPVALVVLSLVLAAVPNILRPGPLGEDLANNPFVFAQGPVTDALLALGDVLGTLVVPVTLLMAVVAVVVRFRRSHIAAREQLKWFVAAVAVAATCVALSFGDGARGVTAFDLVAVASLSLPAVAIGIAVLRYHLYDIDRLISRTIGWAIVTGLLVGTFVLLVLGLQAVLEPLTGGNTLAIAGSTLVVATLFQPVRSRVQGAVDRRFDRSRYDGERLLAAFGERLRDEVDLAAISADVLTTVDAAVRPASAGLWLRERPEGGGA